MDDGIDTERAKRKTPWHVRAWHGVLARAQIIIAVLLTLGAIIRIWKGL